MPEVEDYSRHLQGVDTHILQRSSSLWATPNCFCIRSFGGAKSDIYDPCFACSEVDQDAKLLPDQKRMLLPAADGGWKATDIIDIPLAAADGGWKASDIIDIPLAAADGGWKATDIIDIPPGPPAVEETAEAEAVDAAAFSPSSEQVIPTTTRARAAHSDDRDHLSHARSSPRRSCASPYRGHGRRGRPPNGSRVGPPRFKGVRQRKGVRGFLVEIRPPLWKRTIWLGTYKSDREAAAAHDAGVFYTKKKTKFNFDVLAGTFPALPAGLRLDDAEDHEEIKTFVQREAHKAARTIGNMPAAAGPAAAPAAPESTRETTSSSMESSHPSNIPASTASSTSACEESAIGLAIPEDDWFAEIAMPGMSGAWDLAYCLEGIMKQELSLEPDFVPDEILHDLP